MGNEPITREEMLLNAIATGEAANLEPITREEMFLAKLGGSNVTTPEPITRKEQFLQKAIDAGGSGGGGAVIKNQNKTFTENGTYTADSGYTGLGTVTVNVAGSGEVTPPTPDDGKTRVYIHLEHGRTSPMMGVYPNGTVTVDWGDGTEPDTLTGTSTFTVKWTPTHEYAAPGDYVIALTVEGTMGFYGSSNTNEYSSILRYASGADARNWAYLNAIQKVEIGEGVTTIGSNAFYNCYSLASITIPEGVTSIGSNAFYNCYGIRYYDFTACTSVPTLSSTNAFTGISADCQMLIPAALYDEWSAATNWATYASYMVAV